MKRGFTMVEVLLVTAIFASIGLAVFSSLTNGLKLWSRSQKLVAEEDAAIFFDRFSADIHNTFLYSRFSFEGGEIQLSFPTVVYTPADRASSRAHEGYSNQIGMVRYSFDPSGGRVIREQSNYSQATQGRFSPAQVQVSGVRELSFRYYYSGTSEPAATATNDKSLPIGVEVELRLLGSGDDRILKRYVSIPMGA